MRSMQEDRAQVAAAQSAPETAAPPGAEAEVHSPEARRPGRPRSEQADKAIIDAALSLFAETGPEGLCIEKVAARAGVGKATIYRRWHGKEDLMLDALTALKTPLPEPKGKSVRFDLIALLDAMCADYADPRRPRQIALLQGEGAKYPRLMILSDVRRSPRVVRGTGRGRAQSPAAATGDPGVGPDPLREDRGGKGGL